MGATPLRVTALRGRRGAAGQTSAQVEEKALWVP